MREPSRLGAAARGFCLGALAGFFLRDLGLSEAASFWFPAGLIGAAAHSWRPSRLALAPLVFLLACLWLAAAFTPLSSWLCRGLERVDPPGDPADALVVLGSRLQEDGEATATAESRLLHALELTRSARAPRILVTERSTPPAGHAHLAETLLRDLGLQAEIAAVGPVRNTREEALAVAALCRQRGWSRLVLVTSPLHSRRGALALEHEGLAVASSPAGETRYDLERLERPAERLLAFADALHERVGLAYYAWRGWLARPQGTP